jgi:hypothetical protein
LILKTFIKKAVNNNLRAKIFIIIKLQIINLDFEKPNNYLESL